MHHEPTKGPPDPRDALLGVVYAADSAIQAAANLWANMTPAEQDEWLAWAAKLWPRGDVMLETILPAGERMIDEEHDARDERPGDDGEAR